MCATLKHRTSPPEPPKTSFARKSDFMGAHFIVIDTVDGNEDEVGLALVQSHLLSSENHVVFLCQLKFFKRI